MPPKKTTARKAPATTKAVAKKAPVKKAPAVRLHGGKVTSMDDDDEEEEEEEEEEDGDQGDENDDEASSSDAVHSAADIKVKDIPLLKDIVLTTVQQQMRASTMKVPWSEKAVLSATSAIFELAQRTAVALRLDPNAPISKKTFGWTTLFQLRDRMGNRRTDYGDEEHDDEEYSHLYDEDGMYADDDDDDDDDEYRTRTPPFKKLETIFIQNHCDRDLVIRAAAFDLAFPSSAKQLWCVQWSLFQRFEKASEQTRDRFGRLYPTCVDRDEEKLVLDFLACAKKTGRCPPPTIQPSMFGRLRSALAAYYIIFDFCDSYIYPTTSTARWDMLKFQLFETLAGRSFRRCL